MAEKRKTTTSWQVKERYKKKVYGVIKCSLPKDLVEEFKEKCAEKGIPQAQVIKKAVENFLEEE